MLKNIKQFLLIAVGLLAFYGCSGVNPNMVDFTSVNPNIVDSTSENLTENDVLDDNLTENDTKMSQKQGEFILLSFVGDNVLGDYKGASGLTFNAKFREVGGDFKYFSKNLADILKSDDLSIGNLEGVLSDRDLKNAFDKPFSFKGSSAYTNILREAGIDAVNVANNHTRDYGTEGFKDTLGILKNAKIPHFGEGIIEIIEIKGVKLGFAGHRGWGLHIKPQVKKEIKKLREMGADIVIFTFHWGEERHNIPNSTQKTLAHFAIDSGADLVIGHHPHVLQGFEDYKGKKIAYSLGNFIYGGAKNPKDKDTIIYQVGVRLPSKGEELSADNTIAVEYKNGYELDLLGLNGVDNITIGGKNALLYHSFIPASISSQTSINDYSPRIFAKDSIEAVRIKKRLREYSDAIR